MADHWLHKSDTGATSFDNVVVYLLFWFSSANARHWIVENTSVQCVPKKFVVVSQLNNTLKQREVDEMKW